MNIGSRNIKITPSEFKGKMYISIRQWYEYEGEERPGNKGINLTLEEWDEMIKNLDTIQQEIKEANK